VPFQIPHWIKSPKPDSVELASELRQLLSPARHKRVKLELQSRNNTIHMV